MPTKLVCVGGGGYKLPGPGGPEGDVVPDHAAYVFAFLGDFICRMYRRADKSLARPTSRCILFDG